MVSIAGLDKVELLKRLWEGSTPAGFFMFNAVPPPSFSVEEAKKAVERRIDYFCGRCIKCDLSKDEVDPTLYDRDMGQGAFAGIVAKMRKQ